jgi:hypothetical protein
MRWLGHDRNFCGTHGAQCDGLGTTETSEERMELNAMARSTTEIVHWRVSGGGLNSLGHRFGDSSTRTSFPEQLGEDLVAAW